MNIVEEKLKAMEFSEKEYNKYIKEKVKKCGLYKITNYEKYLDLKFEIVRNVLYDFNNWGVDIIKIKAEANIILKNREEIVKEVGREIDKIVMSYLWLEIKKEEK